MRQRRALLVTKWIAATALTAILYCGVAMAQQPPAQQTQQPAATPQVIWEKMPRMQLQQEYAGPLKDTTVQRYRDPETNLICYIYLPFTAAHSAPTATSYVQYGPNVIGSISCASPPAAAATTAAAKPAPAAAPPAKGAKNIPPETSHPQPPHNEPNPAAR